MTTKLFYAILASAIFFPQFTYGAIRNYHLTIAQEEVTIQNKTAVGMTINGSIPGPTLRFQEGDIARIEVTNTLPVTSSIHWHGILVPPDMDGVPFINQIPIASGETYLYEFPIRQTGTYWYHSHSDLQEQSGLYGSIVIEDHLKRADDDHVILLSDWTTDTPESILRTLKRGSEWYSLEKGSSQSIVGAIKAGRLQDYFMRELQRMPPMDIADVAYDYFLTNGKPEFMLAAGEGETLRLRIINGSATTYFHLNYSGGPMTIISSDGMAVEPVEQDLFLIGVAETYDILLDVPTSGAYEFRATAHDGSGFTSTWIGSGKKYPARDIPKPDLYESMHQGSMSSLFALTPSGSMGMPDSEVDAGTFDKPGMLMGMDGMDHGTSRDMAEHNMKNEKHLVEKNSEPMTHEQTSPPMQAAGSKESATHHDMGKQMAARQLQHPAPMETMSPQSSASSESKLTKEVHSEHSPAAPDMKSQHENGPAEMVSQAEHEVAPARSFGSNFGLLAADNSSRSPRASEGGLMRPGTPYHLLKAQKSTALPTDAPVREIRLTLDGDMERYTWFLNNKPLSETDTILIKEGESVRFIMINRTMMHHPMHLHGHFFRVLNGQGEYAPLKHTVDVAPMSTTVIEFAANESGDWFFHCHLLYHMKSGMARLVHYQDFSPAEDVAAVRNKLYQDPLYFYGVADVLSNMTEGTLALANSRYSVEASWEVGWQGVNETDWEGLLTANYYLNRFTSFFVGADLLGEGSSSDTNRGVLGFGYLLPLNIDSAAWLDTDGGARFYLAKELEITPRLGLHGEVDYDTHTQWEGRVGLSYLISKDFSIIGNWHSEYGLGAGLQVRF